MHSPPARAAGAGTTAEGEAVYVDGAGAHDFRNGVATLLYDYWASRANALRMCGRFAVKLECGDCATPHLVPYRCGARTCPTCSRAGAARIVDRISVRVDAFSAELGDGPGVHGPALPWDGPGDAKRRGWKHLVLTTPALADLDDRFNPAELRRQAKRARAAFSAFWRRTPWGRQVNAETDRTRVVERVSRATGEYLGTSVRRVRSKRARRDTAAAVGLEVSPRGMVHLHVAVFGEYVPQRELADAWARALGVAHAVVHVTALRGDSREQMRKSLREALKYATKGEKGERRVVRAAAVELALRAVRRVEMLGALRRFGDVSEDLTQEDLHAGAVAHCETCETPGTRWVWVEIRGAELVRENGGFGRLNVYDHGVRTDRRCYLGDPPPWWDDDDDDDARAEWDAQESDAGVALWKRRHGLAA